MMIVVFMWCWYGFCVSYVVFGLMFVVCCVVDGSGDVGVWNVVVGIDVYWLIKLLMKLSYFKML